MKTYHVDRCKLFARHADLRKLLIKLDIKKKNLLNFRKEITKQFVVRKSTRYKPEYGTVSFYSLLFSMQKPLSHELGNK